MSKIEERLFQLQDKDYQRVYLETSFESFLFRNLFLTVGHY